MAVTWPAGGELASLHVLYLQPAMNGLAVLRSLHYQRVIPRQLTSDLSRFVMADEVTLMVMMCDYFILFYFE